MKILQIHFRYDRFGGGERYFINLCDALEERGHRVIVVSSRHPDNYHAKDRKEIFIDRSFGLRTGYKMWGRVKDIIKNEDPDIIHLHETFYFLSPYIMRKLIKLKPTVQTLHNSIFFCPKYTKILPGGDICNYGMSTRCIRIGCLREINLPLAFVMYWRVVVARKVDKVIVPSHYLKEESLRNGISLGKIEVVPHFTDKNPKGKYIEPEADTILFVGRTDLLKGIRELVNALSLIKERPWKAYIIGTGDEPEKYIRLSQDLGLGERIIFLKNLDYEAIDEYYQKASMVVFPSMCAESFGLVGIEAMSFGRPVVAFDVGGPREWLVDGETGFLVKRGDIKGLADRILQLLKDGQLVRKMGQKGQERVEKYYRKEMHLKKLLTIYEEAAKKRKEKGSL
jgi:glycosyltransferase involved in cell wall biosynthesis